MAIILGTSLADVIRTAARGGSLGGLPNATELGDTIDGAAGDDRIEAGVGNDTLEGGTGDDFLRGGAGRDRITDSDGNAAALGGDGDDTIELAFAATGSSFAEGGAGDDVIRVTGGSPDQPGGLLTGDDGNDLLFGSAARDVLDDGAGNDVVEGGAGDDSLFHGGGNDLLDGGEGIDEVILSAPRLGIGTGLVFDVTAFAGGDILLAGGTVVLRSVESLNWDLEGVEQVDLVLGDGNDGVREGNYAGTIDFGGGDDVWQVGEERGGASSVHADGGEGFDFIDAILTEAIDFDLAVDGSSDVTVDRFSFRNFDEFSFTLEAGGNRLALGAGEDSILSLIGSDTVDLGGGDDFLLFEYGEASSFAGGEGEDVLVANFTGTSVGLDVTLPSDGAELDLGGNIVSGFEIFVLDLGDGTNRITFGAGEDFVQGGAGSDRLEMGAGRDVAVGGAGDDALFGGDGDDIVDGGTGADLLDGGAGSDTAGYLNAARGVHVDLALAGPQYTREGRDTLRSIENLDGSSFSDALWGNWAANRLNGGNGWDWLVGRGGIDELQGGEGRDSFVYCKTWHASACGPELETILDFETGLDRIVLTRIDADTTRAGNQAFAFIGEAAFGSVAGQLRYHGSVVEGDVNGDGQADLAIRIDNGARLTESSFLL